jgi:hypothetical protein
MEPEKQTREQLAAVIGGQVAHALGQMDHLLRLQVRWLWANRYRVNVFVGADAASARVAHSYFLVTDDAGTIVSSTPEIVGKA